MEKETRKIDTTIKVGDDVRSYDFDYVDDCYVEGKVCEIKDGKYRIILKKKVFGGTDETKKYVETTKNYYFYPPVNGRETWMGSLTCGVQKI